MAETAKKTAKTEKTEKTKVEEFMELEGADLVVPPNALSSANRLRALALFGNMADVDEGDFGKILDGLADAVEWMEANVAKDGDALEEHFSSIEMSDLMEYVLKYVSSVGEM